MVNHRDAVVVEGGPLGRPKKASAAGVSDAMAKWLSLRGFTGMVHHMDARVGGTYRMSFTISSTGQSHALGVKYVELVRGVTAAGVN